MDFGLFHPDGRASRRIERLDKSGKHLRNPKPDISQPDLVRVLVSLDQHLVFLSPSRNLLHLEAVDDAKVRQPTRNERVKPLNVLTAPTVEPAILRSRGKQCCDRVLPLGADVWQRLARPLVDAARRLP